MKVLFIEPYPIEGPSSRYRVEQYIPFLKSNGIKCIVRPFISSKFYAILYKKDHYIRKILFFIQSSIKRLLDLFTALRSDIIFIHLEAFPLGPPIFEYILAIFRKKIIYDLDDAIYMGKTSPANIFLRYLKCSFKVKVIIRISRHIITCNKYLAEYAGRFNSNVSVIHTPIDTEKFFPGIGEKEGNITIGWIGSHTTAPYLSQLEDVFFRLSKKYKFDLKIIGAGRCRFRIDSVKVLNLDWNLTDEIRQFQSLDIGVYPLSENEWTYGKTGFKAIQYMSVGIPCVASRTGANKDIISDGINGFLADTQDEWVQKLSNLIEDKKIREKIGLAARGTIEEKYSLKINAPKIFEIIQKVYRKD